MAKRFTLEAKVGLFFVTCFVLIGVISLKLGNYEIGEATGYPLSAVFSTAAGINDETPVLMAGLRIGQVTNMRLERRHARIFFKVKQDTQVPDDSVISIQSRGFLGAKYLEIMPGENKKFLKPGDQFDNVTMAGEISAVAAQAGDIADDIKAITANLRKVFGDEEGEEGVRNIFNNLQEITDRLAQTLASNQERMNLIAENIERMSSTVAAMSEENREAIHLAIMAMPAIVENLNVISMNIATLTTDNSEAMGDAIQGLSAATSQLQEAMEHIASITRKLDDGEGTLGQLINDPEPMEELNETIESVNEFVGRVRRLQTHVHYRGEYFYNEEEFKSYLSLRLQPRMDKWYTITLIDDPLGRVSTRTTHTWTTVNPGEPDEETIEEIERQQVTSDSFKISAQIAKRWHWFVFRGGIIESTGGAGSDVLLFDDHLMLSVEAFDFSANENPRLKVSMDFLFLDHFFITGGVDDIINRDVLDGYTDPMWFVGGGLMFRDEDISTLFTRIPMPDL